MSCWYAAILTSGSSWEEPYSCNSTDLCGRTTSVSHWGQTHPHLYTSSHGESIATSFTHVVWTIDANMAVIYLTLVCYCIKDPKQVAAGFNSRQLSRENV